MFLFLSAQDISFIEVGLLSDKGFFICWEKIETRPEKFLESVVVFLQKNNCSLNDLKKIIVVKGPGSFTAIRLSVTMANALAFVKGLPIVGLENPTKKASSDLISSLIKSELVELTGNFVQPIYDRPPNITIKKSVFSKIK